MTILYRSPIRLLAKVTPVVTDMQAIEMYVWLHVCSAQETYEQKRQDHLRDMQGKEEQMRQMFVQKV